jgi:hypothetical protein
MFYVTINGTYNGDIPEYTNGTLEVCEDSEIISYTEFNCTQYALLAARNSLACQGYIRVTEGWELAPDTDEVKNALQQNADTIGSDCVVLASGTGYKPSDLSVCATDALKPFSGEELCFATPCTNRILIRGQSLPTCTGSESVPCDANTNANVISQFPSIPTPIPVYPSDYNIYLNNNGGSDARINVPFVVSIPTSPKVDFMLLVDLAGMSSSDYGTIRSETSKLLNLFYTKNWLGLAGFSTLSRDGTFTLRSSLTSSSSSLLSAVDSVTIPSTNTPLGSSDILTAASTLFAANNVGWRNNAYKAVVIITDNDYSTTTTSVSAFNQNSKNAGIIPIFMPTSDVESIYTSLKNSMSLAFVNRVNNDWTFATKGRDSMDAYTKTLQVTPELDSNGFVAALPPIDNNIALPGPYSVLTNVTFAYPASVSPSTEFPLTIELVFWGFYTARVNVYVNHAPVVLSSLPFVTSYNTSLEYTIIADDSDRNSMTLTYKSVTPVDALSFFVDSQGEPIELNTPTTDFKGIFTSDPMFFKGTVNISVVVNDGCADSPAQLIVFRVLEDPNDPPDSDDMKIVTYEDQPASFSLAARDKDPDDALVLNQLQAVVIFVDDDDTRGHFYTDSSKTTMITAGTIINGPRNVYFEPAPDAYSNPTTIPIASFRFQVIDTKGATSPVRTVVVIVLPLNDPPTFDGSTVITIDEDTQASLTLFDLVSDIDSSAETLTVTITQSVTKGTLVECADDGNGGCTDTEITSANVPYAINRLTNEQGRVIFTPVPNDSGNNYANFILRVSDGTDSSTYTVTINVRPVNDPPVIVPHFNVLPDPNEMDEDTELIISWDVTDIDSPIESLKTTITSQIPSVSKMYMCVPNGDGCDRGDQLTVPGEIPAVSPGVFKVILVPDANIYDARSFARLNMYATDDFEARSQPEIALIRVLPINDPPVISGKEFTVTRSEDLKVPLGALQVSDIDVTRLQSVIVTLTVNDNTGTFAFEGNDAEAITEPIAIERGETPSPPCTLSEDGFSVQCRDTLERLNELWFKTIVFYPGETPRHVITVFANDQGHTDKWDRPLNDTKLIIVTVGEDTGLLGTPETDNTLTIAVAVSVAGAVAAVALIIFLVRDKLAGNTDAFFEQLTEPLTTGGVNPIYQSNVVGGENPVYQPNQ